MDISARNNDFCLYIQTGTYNFILLNLTYIKTEARFKNICDVFNNINMKIINPGASFAKTKSMHTNLFDLF